jgi:hypothetical protein
MGKRDKTKAERLTETTNLLTQLLSNGVRKNVISFLDLKQRMSTWVETGEPADYDIPFPEYGRVAVVSLPRYNNKAATIHFKMVRIPENREDTKDDN